jgi:S1-C subfamily serine protease
MSRDDSPSTPPSSATAFLKSGDFLAIAKIYGGLAYLGSLAGSPADRAHLRRGDVVLAVNGIPTPDLEAFLLARGQREGGATVRYVRDGVEKEVELEWESAHSSGHSSNVQ